MFQFFYATNDPEAIHHVRQTFQRLERVTRPNYKEKLVITCEDFHDLCNEETEQGLSMDGYVSAGDRRIVVCPPFFTHSQQGQSASLYYQEAMILKLALGARGELCCHLFEI